MSEAVLLHSGAGPGSLGTNSKRQFHKSVFWRRFARWGATSGPSLFVRWSPPVIGVLFALLLPGARRIVLRNLRRIYGPQDTWREAKDVSRTFAQFACCLAESLGAGRPEAQSKSVRVRGSHHIMKLLDEGRGFVIATAHIGPWDGAAQTLVHEQGVPVMIVMAREDDEAAERLHDEVRDAAHVQVLRIGRHPLDALPALEHLDRGGVVAVQLDRVPPGRPAVETSLFGQSFAVPTGPFLLAALARVPVLPVFSARTGYFDRRITIGQPIQPTRRPSQAELSKLAREGVAQMEHHIACYPTQWFHFISDSEEQSSIGVRGRT